MDIENITETCPGCGRGCPLSHPQCGLGFEYQQELTGEGAAAPKISGDNIRRPEGKHGRKTPSRQHEHGHEHGHGKGHPHGGRHGRHGHHGQDGRGHGPHGAMDFEAPSSTDEKLARVFRHCSRTLVHRERHQGGRASVLAVLDSHGEMTQARLAEKLDIRAASASELIGKMEADGLIDRTPDADDGRAYILKLTDAGKEAAAEVVAERREQDQRLFSALSDEEKEQLTALLDKLAGSWRH